MVNISSPYDRQRETLGRDILDPVLFSSYLVLKKIL